jgi:hypothetical protein
MPSLRSYAAAKCCRSIDGVATAPALPSKKLFLPFLSFYITHLSTYLIAVTSLYTPLLPICDSFHSSVTALGLGLLHLHHRIYARGQKEVRAGHFLLLGLGWAALRLGLGRRLPTLVIACGIGGCLGHFVACSVFQSCKWRSRFWVAARFCSKVVPQHTIHYIPLFYFIPSHTPCLQAKHYLFHAHSGTSRQKNKAVHLV